MDNTPPPMPSMATRVMTVLLLRHPILIKIFGLPWTWKKRWQSLRQWCTPQPVGSPFITRQNYLISRGRQAICPELNGPITRYVILRVAQSPGMPGMFSLQPTSKETVS